jgi:hypothetical protein
MCGGFVENALTVNICTFFAVDRADVEHLLRHAQSAILMHQLELTTKL